MSKIVLGPGKSKLIKVYPTEDDYDEDIIDSVFKGLKRKKIYRPGLIYRIASPDSETSLAKKMLSNGMYKRAEDIFDLKMEENEFWADWEENVLDNYNNRLIRDPTNLFCYVGAYDPEKITEVKFAIYKFNEPKKKKDALVGLVEINYKNVFQLN